MTTRSEVLRKRNRKVLAWSMAIAVVVHVAAFLLVPSFGGELRMADSPPGGEEVNLMIRNPTFVDVTFGPPDIFDADGAVWKEPADRVLQADRILSLPTQCEALSREGRVPALGRVRLRVNASGRVNVMGLAEGTGDPCADEVITTVAADLWYRWLPNERFAAPVDLIQPITLEEARN